MGALIKASVMNVYHNRVLDCLQHPCEVDEK
jgi:hypothetical protein